MFLASALLASIAILAPDGASQPSAIDAALRLVPKGSVAFVLVPNPKAMSDDLQQCIERMNRPEAAIAGRPIDQLKAMLGVAAAFDDHGPVAVALVPTEGLNGLQPIALLPATDPDQFLKGNFTAAPDVAPDAWKAKDGTTLFAKPVGKHVALAPSADLVHAYAANDGGPAAIREHLGERASRLLAKGDVVAWAGPAAMHSFFDRAASQMDREMPADQPFAAEAKAMRERTRKLLEGAEDGLLVADIDPLGLSLRTWGRFGPESDLGKVLVGGKDRASTFDHLPQLPFYFAMRMDVQGLGGLAALEAVLRMMPGEPQLPTWLAASKDGMQGLQFGVYPSKMGIATGGLLNDALLFVETSDPKAMRAGLHQAVMAMAGESGGLKREPTWTADKELKSGEVVDAFEVKESLATDGKDAKAGDVAIRRLVSQFLYGSRGFVGFVKAGTNGVTMTFSQRSDVLSRALATAAGGKSLANDATLAAYRDWLIEGSDVEGFIGVGQFGKLFQQVAQMVPGGAEATLPEIPTSVEPVAFAFEVDRGTLESALVIPTGVLALFYDQARGQVLGTGAAGGGAAK